MDFYVVLFVKHDRVNDIVYMLMMFMRWSNTRAQFLLRYQ